MRSLILAAALAAFAAPTPDGLTDSIDRRTAERWEAEGVRPAPPAGDHEFLRRLSLDLRGVIPGAAEVVAFAADPDPAKRGKIVDAWLRSEAFAHRWAGLWCEQLGMRRRLKEKLPEIFVSFEEWVRDAVRSNMPFDRFARRVLTAKGPHTLDPAAGFMVTGFLKNSGGAKDVVERASRLFLGTQIRCAECHDHPFDDWTQQDFYGMAAFFAQSRSTGQGGGAWGVIDDPSVEDLFIPGAEEKRSIPPAYRTGGEPAESESRRAAFARLMVADRQFARAAVNRHWGILLGRGLVDPLDGFTATRKPSHPELLDELAEGFVRSGYDVRRLIRSIVLSRPYQLSSRTAPGGAVPARLFARAHVAPLSAEALFDSIVLATALDAPFASSKGKGDVRGGLREAFLREFRPAFEEGDTISSGGADGTISQALYFLNGELTAQAARADAGGGLLPRLLASEPDPGRRIDQLFLSTLSRPPTQAERSRLLERVGSGDSKPYEDLLWALINSTEFVTRH